MTVDAGVTSAPRVNNCIIPEPEGVTPCIKNWHVLVEIGVCKDDTSKETTVSISSDPLVMATSPSEVGGEVMIVAGAGFVMTQSSLAAMVNPPR